VPPRPKPKLLAVSGHRPFRDLKSKATPEGIARARRETERDIERVRREDPCPECGSDNVSRVIRDASARGGMTPPREAYGVWNECRACGAEWPGSYD
jgi:ribosomal protein L37AE/L43A